MVWGRYCACEILIANPIDWLFAACLEYFFFSIDSSEARKNMYMPDMQTINYALERTHFFISILPIFKWRSFARHRQFTLLGFRTVSWTNRNILFDVIDTWFQILFTM